MLRMSVSNKVKANPLQLDRRYQAYRYCLNAPINGYSSNTFNREILRHNQFWCSKYVEATEHESMSKNSDDMIESRLLPSSEEVLPVYTEREDLRYEGQPDSDRTESPLLVDFSIRVQECEDKGITEAAE